MAWGEVSTGLPAGPPHVGQCWRPKVRRLGSVPRWPASTRRSITCATWYRCRSAGNTNAAARAFSRASSSARSDRLRVISLVSNQDTSAARPAGSAARDALAVPDGPMPSS